MTPTTLTPASDTFLDELREFTEEQLAQISDEQLTRVLVSLRMLVFGIKNIPNELMNKGVTQIREFRFVTGPRQLKMVLEVVPQLRELRMQQQKPKHPQASPKAIAELDSTRGLPPSGSRSKAELRRDRRRKQAAPTYSGQVPEHAGIMTAEGAAASRDHLRRIREATITDTADGQPSRRQQITVGTRGEKRRAKSGKKKKA